VVAVDELRFPLDVLSFTDLDAGIGLSLCRCGRRDAGEDCAGEEGNEGDGAGGEGFFRALDDGAVGEASSAYVVGDIVADMWEGKEGDSFLSKDREMTQFQNSDLEN